MRPRGTICCRGSFCHGEKVSRSNNSPWQKLSRQQIVPRGRILLASLREKITPTPNKTLKEATMLQLLLPLSACPSHSGSVDFDRPNDRRIDLPGFLFPPGVHVKHGHHFLCYYCGLGARLFPRPAQASSRTNMPSKLDRCEDLRKYTNYHLKESDVS
ncbi:hypothetical protein Bbelb_103440 [Branchiostoma belcheri]|nr:hypothetical protein Bbelb_103440 [Branchiostoma belcheri]